MINRENFLQIQKHNHLVKLRMKKQYVIRSKDNVAKDIEEANILFCYSDKLVLLKLIRLSLFRLNWPDQGKLN